MPTWTIASDRVQLGVTVTAGHLDNVRFQTSKGEVRPLHTAPWADEPHAPDVPPILRVLRGDFFCAPFGANDLAPEETRIHGSPANADWQLVAQEPTRLELRLTRPVLGAEVRKRVHLRPGHAVIYQEHTLTGGRGAVPLGHHAMLAAGEPLLLGFSPWTWGGTPPDVFEPDPQTGRCVLAYPQEFTDLAAVRRADGGTLDLRTFPALDRDEELVMLVADERVPFAWSAATAPRAGWVWFSLRSPQTLRSTVLWMSNGGRFYPPWSSRHTGVIGIEEVTSFFHLGHRRSTEPNVLNARGVPTAVTLDPQRPTCVRYAFGVSAVPAGFGRVARITPAAGGVVLHDEADTTVYAPADLEFVTQAL